MRINLNDKNKQFDRMFKIMENLENQTLLTEGADYSGLQNKFFNQFDSSLFSDIDYSTDKEKVNIVSYATDELSNSKNTAGLYDDFCNYWIIDYKSKRYLIEVHPGTMSTTEDDRNKIKKNQKDGNGKITLVYEIKDL